MPANERKKRSNVKVQQLAQQQNWTGKLVDWRAPLPEFIKVNYVNVNGLCKVTVRLEEQERQQKNNSIQFHQLLLIVSVRLGP